MEEWEKIARTLPCGRSTRVNCCRQDLSRVINHTPKGYGTYCFRCGEDSKEFVPHGVLPLSKMLEHKEALDAYTDASGPLSLPTDFEVLSDNSPREAWVWLFKAGVSSSIARHYGFGYSESLARVVLPVRDISEQLVCVQSRAIYERQTPKYLNLKVSTSRAVFRSDDQLLLKPDEGIIVVTEDILSAVRVGRLYPCISTLGTTLTYTVAMKYLTRARKVYIWYDGDEAGVNGASKAAKVLTVLGVSYGIIKTNKDPKRYNNDEIKDIVSKMETSQDD